MNMWLLGFSLLLLADAVAPDPCTDHKYIYDTGGRSPKCPYQPEECDRYITENWYKVVNYYGALEMPTSHVDINSCGANYPGWLNGTLPSDADGTVDMTVCVSFYNEPCKKQITIQVKNCGHFYVYYLKKMDGCSERYCFGTNGDCPTTTVAPTTAAPTTAAPTTAAPTTAQPTLTPRTLNNYCECTSEIYRTLTICLATLGAAAVLCFLLKLYYNSTRPRVSVHDLSKPAEKTAFPPYNMRT